MLQLVSYFFLPIALKEFLIIFQGETDWVFC